MNKTYRLIWNDLTRTWVAVAEIARARGKRASGAVLLAAAGILLAAPPAPTFAAPPGLPVAPTPTQLPTGGKVVGGQAGIAQSGATLNINQSSQRAAIDWSTFNVGRAAQVNFNQPGASSVTLNRVLDSNPSQIFGHINANGQVFLSNPNGVYFSPTASVDVGALVATTHSISLADFMAGKTSFERNGTTASVVNEGELKAALGGYPQRHPVFCDIDGITYRAIYWVAGKILTVSTGKGGKSKQIGSTKPETLAKQLLGLLAKDGKAYPA